jgi:hypothetical protein
MKKLRSAEFAILAAVLAAGGCAAGPGPAPAEKPRPAAAAIVDLLTVEEPERFTVIIRADRPLEAQVSKTEAPPAVVCRFAGAAVDRLGEANYPPPNAVVKVIRAAETGGAGGGVVVRIELYRAQSSYTVATEANDLKIVFTRPPAAKTAAAGKGRGAAAKPVRAAPAAGTLRRVSVAAGAEGVLIALEVAGSAPAFKTLRMENPAFFVVDLPGTGSVFKGEQRVAVDSPYVGAVRHFAHPDKVRVVVETATAHLGTCTVRRVPEGLAIAVGRPPAAKEN